MKNVCIWGGGGFIGIRLVKKLYDSGYNITVIGRSAHFPLESYPGVKYYNIDSFENQTDLFDWVDVAIYLAYTTTPKTSFDDPLKDIKENLDSAVQLFDKLLGTKVKKLIYVSSGGTVYGAHNYPVQEEHSTDPISPYGITKLAIEKYALMYWKTKGLPAVIARPSNAYGIGQYPFKGQGFIATAIASIIKKRSVNIFGSGGTIRDYIYIDDLVEGILSVMKFGKVGECYNLGTGTGFSNLEVIEILKPLLNKLGYSVEFKILPERPFDVPINILNSGKIFQESGWCSTTDIRSGLLKTVDWIQRIL